MKHLTKKMVSAFLALIMTVSLITVSPVAAATPTGTVSFTIERLTIGQGFYVEPMQVTIDSDDTVKDVFEKGMELVSGSFKYTSEWGFYLTGIDNADTKKINIPQEIVIMPEYQYSYIGDDGLEHMAGYKAPSNVNNDGNKDNILGQGDYNAMSGWMFTLNNVSLPASADQVKVKNGDVVRLQFSVYGYGADLGFDTSSYTGIPLLKMANKDELIKAVAGVNAKKSYWMAYPNVASAYNNAMTVLKTYNPSQETVNAALNVLRSAETSPTYPTVPKASISKLKNLKGKKVRITVKKLSGVTGYKYIYANNKKLKNKITRITVKNIITTKKIKKLKKNKRVYVKVCAYKKVNGKKVFGSWSRIKYVTVKK